MAISVRIVSARHGGPVFAILDQAGGFLDDPARIFLVTEAGRIRRVEMR